MADRVQSDRLGYRPNNALGTCRPKHGAIGSSTADRDLSAVPGPTGTRRPSKGRQVLVNHPWALYIGLDSGSANKKLAAVVMASGGSSSGKGFGFGREKGARKGAPIVWPGSIGPEDFLEAVYEFPVESCVDLI